MRPIPQDASDPGVHSIQVCPHCKRVGLMIAIGGASAYVHRRVIRTNAESGESFMLNEDRCPAEFRGSAQLSP